MPTAPPICWEVLISPEARPAEQEGRHLHPGRAGCRLRPARAGRGSPETIRVVGPVFEQKNVESPKFWSQTATNIVAQKYFRGSSVKQMIGCVVDTGRDLPRRHRPPLYTGRGLAQQGENEIED